VIVSFGDAATKDVYDGVRSARARRVPEDVRRRVYRKLDMLNAAVTLDDLRSPPGNHLEPLRGDLSGFHSIRVNEQWRIVFRWSEGNARDVRLTDYH
jgi:proteic killer suppression protein